MVDVHRIGFTRLPLGNSAKDECHVNIIFVHGLRGHPRRTWEDHRGARSEDDGATSSSKRKLASIFKRRPKESTAVPTNEGRSGKVFWPDEYLTEDIPDARVWTYGYNADAISGFFEANNKNSVSMHGRDLQVQIERDIDNEDPIVFVAHSLGGIIVKDAIRRSGTCRTRTKLIIFLGTPHRGSSSAGWAEIASNLARLALQDSNNNILATLQVNSEVLNNIHEDFQPIVPEFNIQIHSFQESRGITGMKGLHSKVVDDFSSKLDLRPFETVESIDANHMQMARCNGKTDEQYRKIVGVLQQFMRKEASGGDKTITQALSSTAIAAATQQTIAASNLGEQSVSHPTMPCYCIPFAKNKRFVGRESIVDELTKMLFLEKKCQKAALVGLGGVGKTQVALRLAYWAKDYNHRPKFSVFWISAFSGPAFEQSYTEIARKLQIQKINDEDDLKELVQRYLSSEAAGPWLLIVDNADDMDMLFGNRDVACGIADYLPESDSGLILFTTRSLEVASSAAGGDRVELREVSLEEAKGIFEKSLDQKGLVNNSDTTELMNELACLPLAITQAAAYLNRNQVSVAKYLQLLRGTEKDASSLISRELYDSTRYKGSRNAVANTWLLSFDQIRKSDSAAAHLLSFISRIEPKAIPRSILPILESEEQMVHAVGTLRGYAFIAERNNSGVYDMHSLMHLVTRIWVDKHGLVAQSIHDTIQHVVTIFPPTDYTNRTLWRQYLPHVLRILRQKEGVGLEPRYQLCYLVGECFGVDGQIKEAVRLHEESYQWRKEQLAQDHPDRLASQQVLAIAYRNNGQTKKAIELLEYITNIEKTTLAEDHPDRLASQHELAVAYRNNGQTKKAIELLEYITDIQKTTLAEDHPDRLASQHVLAMVYRSNGQTKKAIELLEYITDIRKTTLAEDHPSRLASQHELAIAYENNGQTKKAIELLEYITDIQKTTLAEDHPDRLTSEHVLAIAYRNNGQTKKAIELLEYITDIQKTTLAEDHPDRLTSQHELAVAYQINNKINPAIKKDN